MKGLTRIKKEEAVIDAAEKVFSTVGFKNARMEDIAKEGSITKVTLYTYFQSKENLYMAVTFRALDKVKELYQQCLEKNINKSGLDSTIALTETYMDFCEKNYLYSEALLELFALNRSTSQASDQSKLTDALKESTYFKMVQDLQNFPFKVTASEMKRGIKDGSINPNIDPMFQTLHGWTMIVGYIKVVSASGGNATPLFKVSLLDLKKFNLELTRKVLANEN